MAVLRHVIDLRRKQPSFKIEVNTANIQKITIKQSRTTSIHDKKFIYFDGFNNIIFILHQILFEKNK